MRVKFETWLQYCREYSAQLYGYDGLVDDHEERFMALFNAGETVREAVQYVGDRYDLDTDPWGGDLGPPCNPAHREATR